MTPRITPIDATLGAVVTDLRLAAMDESTWRIVERAFHDHAVLVFPGQHLAEGEQVAFANRFGDIELLAPDPSLKARVRTSGKRAARSGRATGPISGSEKSAVAHSPGRETSASRARPCAMGSFPSRMGIALRARPTQWVGEPFGMIDEPGAARPFEQIAWPVGCDGSGSSRVKRPFSTVAIVPQRAMQRAQ